MIAIFVHKGSVSRRPDDKQVIFMATQREMFCSERQEPGALVIDGRIRSIIRNRYLEIVLRAKRMLN
ncbi:MAG: hypothetical protein DME94_01705 [Verrucomicrobia bacterium]|nr:MAG: hypothetical protein DME94_01705 [Verrucomicrobiota bacterium]